jgi:hypothetical protein
MNNFKRIDKQLIADWALVIFLVVMLAIVKISAKQ